eukprot:2404792-Rhodomonas_salina.1
MYHKARHIDTRVYHLRELCKEGVMVLEKVASAGQVADSLTKSMPKPAFEKHRASMMGLQSAPGDPAPSLAPIKSRIIATGANAEDIEMGDDDDDEHGMIALGDVVPDLAGPLFTLFSFHHHLNRLEPRKGAEPEGAAKERRPDCHAASCSSASECSAPCRPTTSAHLLCHICHKFNGAFKSNADRGQGIAELEPTDALLAICPFNLTRPASGLPLESYTRAPA